MRRILLLWTMLFLFAVQSSPIAAQKVQSTSGYYVRISGLHQSLARNGARDRVDPGNVDASKFLHVNVTGRTDSEFYGRYKRIDQSTWRRLERTTSSGTAATFVVTHYVLQRGSYRLQVSDNPEFENPMCMATQDIEVTATLTKKLLTSERERLARVILEDDDIILADSHSSGMKDDATALDNIRQTANGDPAERSEYGNAPGGTTELHIMLLNGIVALSQTHGYSFSISELAGGSHSRLSRHYAGLAFDVNVINGSRVSARNEVREFMQHCRDLGATEVLGPGDPGHDTHVHAAWPRTRFVDSAK